MAGDPNMKSLTEIIAEQYVAEAEQGILDERAKAHRFRGWEKGRIYTHRRNPFPTLGRRVASFIFACLLAGTMVISVEAVCLPGSGFLTKTIENWIHVLFDRSDVTSAPTTIETVYLPTYLPEGYVLAEQERLRASIYTVWEKMDGTKLSLDQCTLSTQIEIKAENTVEIEIAGIRVLYHEAVDFCSYYWSTEEYQYYLIVEGKLLPEEVETVINSIQMVIKE